MPHAPTVPATPRPLLTSRNSPHLPTVNGCGFIRLPMEMVERPGSWAAGSCFATDCRLCCGFARDPVQPTTCGPQPSLWRTAITGSCGSTSWTSSAANSARADHPIEDTDPLPNLAKVRTSERVVLQLNFRIAPMSDDVEARDRQAQWDQWISKMNAWFAEGRDIPGEASLSNGGLMPSCSSAFLSGSVSILGVYRG